MTYNLQKYQEIAITLLNKSVKNILFIFIGLFTLSGEPISLHLLLCDPFAVDHHSGMGHASHLQQPRGRLGRVVNKSS
jgi:hypothetical protein